MAETKQAESKTPASALLEWSQGDFAIDVGSLIVGVLPDSDSDEQIEPRYDDDTKGFVVVSQTCDIVRDPAEVPFVAVAPIVRVDLQRMREIEAGRVPRMALLPGAPENHVVDLDRIMTISKELLLTWNRNVGVHSDRDRKKLGHALERKFGRFAFPDDFNVSIRSLPKRIHDKHKKNGSELGQSLRSIQEIRVTAEPDWDADQVRIGFIFLLVDESFREVKDPVKVREQVEKLIDAIDWSGRFKPSETIPVRVVSYSGLSATEYVESFPLDVNAISFANKFSQH